MAHFKYICIAEIKFEKKKKIFQYEFSSRCGFQLHPGNANAEVVGHTFFFLQKKYNWYLGNYKKKMGENIFVF